jgi:glycosyltransferase involved in cell wall biosynthesis
MTPREVSSSAFAIVANGFADGPAQALRDYVVGQGARVVTVFHPLTREQGSRHVVAEYADGRELRSRTTTIPLRPPLSFALDPLVPLRVPAVDLWLGFNPLACARGLAARRFGRTGRVVLWSVDFVPKRFGRTPLTRLYDTLDRLCCTHADARIELSAAAREARDRHHGLEPSRVPTYVVPMGAWLERVPTVPDDGFERRRVIFLGHLVPRQGVDLLLEALALLASRDEQIAADIVGSGSEEEALRARARELGLGESVSFHGFVPDHRDVERLLAGSSLAVAPYRPSVTTFTQHADPGKLKAYVAAGLPIVLTDVPPNAGELVREAGAELVSYEASALADAIASGLGTPERWQERRAAALAYARRFDWPELLGDVLERLGFRSG